jgi:hypothetical protein
MQPEISQQIKQLEEKIEAVYKSVEKTRKYFLWTMIITVVAFVLPLIILAFVIPSFIREYLITMEGLM